MIPNSNHFVDLTGVLRPYLKFVEKLLLHCRNPANLKGTFRVRILFVIENS